MLLLFSFKARLANSLNFDTELLQPEALRQIAVQFHRANRAQLEVRNGVATRANQMMMRCRVGIHEAWALRLAYVAQHAGLNEGLEVFINGGQRNRRQVLFNLYID